MMLRFGVIIHLLFIADKEMEPQLSSFLVENTFHFKNSYWNRGSICDIVQTFHEIKITSYGPHFMHRFESIGLPSSSA